jgi:hypothetical protein
VRDRSKGRDRHSHREKDRSRERHREKDRSRERHRDKDRRRSSRERRTRSPSEGRPTDDRRRKRSVSPSGSVPKKPREETGPGVISRINSRASSVSRIVF